jgi:chemosensory pili system protein ChpA (sensor histidine kinase/response regulator)
MERKVIAVVDDLFFASKIRGTAEQAGVSITIPRTAEQAIQAALDDAPNLVICDLHAQKIDPFELARHMKADDRLRAIPLLGFFSHVQTQLQADAKQAGFDQVIPRSAFAKNLISILQGLS